jgi:hypothetical protein
MRQQQRFRPENPLSESAPERRAGVSAEYLSLRYLGWLPLETQLYSRDERAHYAVARARMRSEVLLDRHSR